MQNIILRKAILTTTIGALLLGGTAGHCLHAAEPQPAFRTAGIFTDHMVLQRDQPLPVWGWAALSPLRLARKEKTLATKGKALEIKAEFTGGQNSEYGVKVFCSPDGKEETIIKYYPINNEIVIDFIHSSKNAPVKMGSVLMGQTADLGKLGFREKVSEQRAPFELKKGETLQLNIFIDKAIIEVFANGRQCITQVIYPEMENSNEVKIFSGDEQIKVDSVDVWKMATTNSY